MDMYLVIKDLTTWIENNLETSISINHVSNKSGYSKWHIQRIFKRITGECLGEYIRSRRLSKSALDLRLTSKSIIDIAFQYHFKSQQTFTRAFTRKFGIPPAKYRNSDSWIMQEFTSPIFFEGTQRGEVVFLSKIKLLGKENRYYCKNKFSPESKHKNCQRIFLDFISNYKPLSDTLYGIHGVQSENKRHNTQVGFFSWESSTLRKTKCLNQVFFRWGALCEVLLCWQD